jgi:catechol 2,3-dioxygenase-like lactoylglutathione lyase family enzyme
VLRGIDHLVIAVPSLEAAAKDFRDLGFTVVEGGRHPVGTYNALVAFADGAYLELIGFYERNPNHRWWEALQRGGGLVDFCMQTDDLAGDTAAFRRAGVDIADPAPQSRKRPDGYQLQWVFSLSRGADRGVAPFIIQDVTPREERIPRETSHANGVTAIGTLTVAVADLAAVRGRWEAALGRPAETVRRDDLQAAGARFTVGPHTLDFVAPHGAQGPLAEWLAARGASPYMATLATRSGRKGRLDAAKTHGARLFFA